MWQESFLLLPHYFYGLKILSDVPQLSSSHTIQVLDLF